MNIAVLGPGSWGLTISWLLANSKDQITIWGLPQFIKPIEENRSVKKPVTVTIPDNVHLTDNLAEATNKADIILFVVPSDAVRPVATELKAAAISKDTILVSLAKGFELSTLFRMSEVLKQEMPDNPVATLSGPTLAMEILANKPTAASIASEEEDVARYVQKALYRENILRLYTNKDLIGVELGGSLKNVIAIATGFAYALDLGHNTIGAIITRGLAEIVRLSVKLGANPSTLYGLSGIGDLIATCNSPTSRNYRVGNALARGQKIDDIVANLGSVAEGVNTAEAVYKLSEKYNIEMPLSKEVLRLIRGEVSPKEAICNMMTRELKS
ncbi:MAG: NAD(P)H-dependent glycerol-3-phosphate dehydrogenase, partial [Cyanobacteriota bacterium]